MSFKAVAGTGREQFENIEKHTKRMDAQMRLAVFEASNKKYILASLHDIEALDNISTAQKCAAMWPFLNITKKSEEAGLIYLVCTKADGGSLKAIKPINIARS